MIAALAAFVFAAAQLPKIDIVYPPSGAMYDRMCHDASPDAIAAAAKLRPVLEEEWNREGPRYLKVVADEIGLRFPYAEMQATLTVCPSTVSMSSPLFINVRQYLAGAARPAPLADFPEKVFHEVMHHYAAQLRDTSAMRKKYASEPQVVLSHLHVIALEKLVLTKLGKTDELQFLEHEYKSVFPPEYRRAWEIVDNAENYHALLDELKAFARNH